MKITYLEAMQAGNMRDYGMRKAGTEHIHCVRLCPGVRDSGEHWPELPF